MLKGHIDLASRDRVEGWLCSDGGSLRESGVMAFVGATCVGQGSVDVFRQDLANAGLGDGWAGFGFSIQLQIAQDPSTVVIRLADSDAYLLPGSHVLKQRAQQEGANKPYPAATDLNWMRGKGWLAEELHQRLRMLSAFGVAQVPLPEMPPEPSDAEAADVLKRNLVELFDVLLKRPHRLDALSIRDEHALHSHVGRHRGEFPELPLFAALWASGRLAVSVVEGSYYRLDDLVPTLPNEVRGRGAEHEVGPATALMINLDSAFAMPGAIGWPSTVMLVLPGALR